MANQPDQSSEKQFRNRKSETRAEREARQTRNILGLAIGVTIVVAGLLIYGFVEQRIVIPNQPAARVGEAEIPFGDFAKMVRLERAQVINQLYQTYNQMQMFGGDEQMRQYFENQINSLQFQLDDPTFIGQRTLDNMIRNEIVRQEAERLGVDVPKEDVDRMIEEMLGYYRDSPDGHPTLVPTFTPVPTTTIDPNATPVPAEIDDTANTDGADDAADTGDEELEATAGPPPTEAPPTPTLFPTPTATAYTTDAFAEDLDTFADGVFQTSEMSLDDYRRLVIEPTLLAEAVRDALFAGSDEIVTTSEEVHARHILFAQEDEELANEVLAQILDGGDFVALAAEYSTDESNKNDGGDLGFFGRGQMVAPFEEAAFNNEVGVVPELVNTAFGWHIIEVLAHEERELSESELENEYQSAFIDWLDAAREEADIEEFTDFWQSYVPTEPEFGPGG